MYKTLKDFDFTGKRVIVRVDFNVPLKEGKVDNDKRIRSALPTINYLHEHEAKIILMSHLGRPKGKIVDELRMDPVAERLSELTGKKVTKLDDCVGEDVEKAVKGMAQEEIILLENLRFHAEEKENDDAFAQKLSRLADIYINDAFGAMHRAHASVEAITKHLPSGAGLLVEKELEMLSKVDDPERPFYAILGGLKVSDKIKVIDNLLKKVDKLFIGGAMMCTFGLAKGYEMGKSVIEPDKVGLAKELMKNEKLILPTDTVTGESLTEEAKAETYGFDKVPKDRACLDVGPETVKSWKGLLNDAKTIIWNGPLGLSEVPSLQRARMR